MGETHMVMTEVLEKLKTLQDILAQKNKVETAINDAPKLLSTQEELLARLKKGYIEKNELYEKTRHNLTTLKMELFDAEGAREKAEKAMDTITTQREYEALDKEIREAGEREQTVRKEIQKEDRTFQELKEDLKREEALIAQQEEELNERKVKLSEEIEAMNKELNDLKEAEEAVSPGLNPETKFKLERIIKSKQGIGIVAIHGNVCTGCHMILPAQFANEVRVGDKIVYCPYCSRILFYLESADGEDVFFNEEDAGSLADLDDFMDDEEGDGEDADDDSDLDDDKMDYED
ncbi:C4-type zinc ribbon domain-containing protein [Brucepastera parasyntrophica]|uniref:zinc ribbon domain-containing protein n=1 Tax=Brucepastera parasyntrophica TaxID=2880008 RepID=UPI00210D4286|nr:C4-type zinc ribbon domain-containing protein [Brucepastera parasyntrophica]ULQ59986.1 C4-type zinc ribbon domain-containing protein [Brucepastera parasyntrophica]